MPAKFDKERYIRLRNEAQMAAAAAAEPMEKVKQQFLADHYAAKARSLS